MKNPSKFWVLAQMEHTQSFGPFWGPIYHWKTKNIAKTQNFSKAVSFVISNNISSTPQKNHRILVKLSTKNIFWTQIGFKLPPEGRAKGSSEILTLPILGSSIYTLWMPSFNFSAFVALDFTQKKQLQFLIQGPIGSIFGTIPPVVHMPFKGFWISHIFKETGQTQSLSFLSNFDLNLLPEDGWNQIQPSGYPNWSKSRTYLLSIFNEKYNYLLCYLDFFQAHMGPGSKIQRSLLRLAPLFQQLLIKRLIVGEMISVVCHFKLKLLF